MREDIAEYSKRTGRAVTVSWYLNQFNITIEDREGHRAIGSDVSSQKAFEIARQRFDAVYGAPREAVRHRWFQRP